MARLLETVHVTAISRLRVTASWAGTSARSENASSLYTPPPGFVVLNTETRVHSSNNGSRSVNIIGGGLNLITETKLEEVFDAAIDFAGQQSNDTLRANLSERKRQAVSELRKYSANMNTIQAIVSARAHGSPFDRKRGWEEISVEADLLYLGASSEYDVAASLEEEFNIDIPDMGVGQ